MTSDQLCLIALGANADSHAGRPAQTIRAAIAALAEGPGRIEAISRLYRTPAFPPGSGPEFVNGAAAVRMPGNAEAVLARLHEVEARFGRARTVRWGRRTLDLDLIAMGNAVLPDPETHRRWRDLDPAAQRRCIPDRLILPHPRLQDRAFVLVPLAEIMGGTAPEWRHPLLGRSVQDMLDALPRADVETVLPL